MITEKLRERFCKDYSIPINIFEEPLFSLRISLMGYEEKYNNFIKMIATKFNNNEQVYFEYYNNLKDRVIQYIKNSETYKALENIDIKEIQPNKRENNNLSQSNIYKENNIGKTFISIDMCKANFSALCIFGKTNNVPLFDNLNYKDFMRQFTDIDYFAESKYIRQVIFENCNPKRQVTYENKIMYDLLNRLLDNKIIDKKNIYSICSDEIIIEVPQNITGPELQLLINNELQYVPFGSVFKNELFILGKIKGTEAYIKSYKALSKQNKNYELKCVNAVEAPFIYKFINDEEITQDDRITKLNARKCLLLDSLEISITYQNENDKLTDKEPDIELADIELE